MRNFIVALALIALGVASTDLQAQAIKFTEGDTVWVNTTEQLMTGNGFITTDSSEIILQWVVLEQDLPQGWVMRSLCDNVTCYFVVPDSMRMDTIRAIDSDSKNRLEIKVENTLSPDTGMIRMLVSTVGRAIQREIVYMYVSEPGIGVNDVTANGNIRAIEYRMADGRAEFVNPFRTNQTYRLMSLTGQLVASGTVSGESTQSLPTNLNGIYLLTVGEGAEMATRKVLVR